MMQIYGSFLNLPNFEQILNKLLTFVSGQKPVLTPINEKPPVSGFTAGYGRKNISAFDKHKRSGVLASLSLKSSYQ